MKILTWTNVPDFKDVCNITEQPFLNVTIRNTRTMGKDRRSRLVSSGKNHEELPGQSRIEAGDVFEQEVLVMKGNAKKTHPLSNRTE